MPFYAEGAGIPAVAVIGGTIFPLILLSSYMVREFLTHEVRQKDPYLFLDVHADVLQELRRNILNFLD